VGVTTTHVILWILHFINTNNRISDCGGMFIFVEVIHEIKQHLMGHGNC